MSRRPIQREHISQVRLKEWVRDAVDAEKSDDFRVHAKSRTRTYRIWAGVMTRTRDPNHKGSQRYRELGIDCDPRWRLFSEFFADMGPCPDGKSIDRINNLGGYWPDNCRWATTAEQARNTRRNIWVMLDGERMILKDALHSLGYSFHAFMYQRRVNKALPQDVVDLYATKRKEPRL